MNELVSTSASVESEITINIFPNPAKETIRIDSKSEFDYFRIYDNRGVVVMENIFTSDGVADISNLQTGLYFLQLFSHSSQRQWNKKFQVVK